MYIKKLNIKKIDNKYFGEDRLDITIRFVTTNGELKVKILNEIDKLLTDNSIISNELSQFEDSYND